MAPNLNLRDLGEAITHWLEYEKLCGREHLLSEASLKNPIAEYLYSIHNFTLLAEEPYPSRYQPQRGRPRSVDFCLCRETKTWVSIFETKFVTGKRDISQEIFDDLIRLEAVRHHQSERFERYIIIAGVANSIQERLFQRRVNLGDKQNRQLLFDGILSNQLDESVKVNVYGDMVSRREYWASAAGAFSQEDLPLTLKSKLRADINLCGNFRCLIWQINSSSKRKTQQIAEPWISGDQQIP